MELERAQKKGLKNLLTRMNLMYYLFKSRNVLKLICLMNSEILMAINRFGIQLNERAILALLF